jgi:uncharacterized iron-regulated membrane protein
MSPAFWARRTHKWIALVIGIQALLWMVSGLYMTAISINTIHGDHLAKPVRSPLAATAVGAPEVVAAGFADIRRLRLKHWFGRNVYEVSHRDGTDLVDARTGERLTPIRAGTAQELAQSFYRGSASVQSVTWITTAPQEIANRPAPMWQIVFDDRSETTLYVSPHTGELLGRRHRLWRWFDLLWALHIMDYEERSDINNTLLRVAASVGLLFALGGVWLLLYSFRRRVPA